MGLAGAESTMATPTALAELGDPSWESLKREKGAPVVEWNGVDEPTSPIYRGAVKG